MMKLSQKEERQILRQFERYVASLLAQKGASKHHLAGISAPAFRS